MAKFIKLTDGAGSDVYVNPEQIVGMERTNAHTYIFTTAADGMRFRVMESLERIEQLILENQEIIFKSA
jgi:hypothetical protein